MAAEEASILGPEQGAGEPVLVRGVTSEEWEVVERWDAARPSTEGLALGIGVVFESSDGATVGQVRLVATDPGGTPRRSEPVVVSGAGWHRTSWIELAPSDETAGYAVELQVRRTSGTGALLVIEAKPVWVLIPDQGSGPIEVAAHAIDWAPSSGPVPNPDRGSGRPLLLMAVAPGPAFDDLAGEPGRWIDPPGADLVLDYELGDGEDASFVQRFRVWFIEREDGAADYTFGYQTTAAWPVATTTQSRAILSLTGSVVGVRASRPGPITTGPGPADFPAVPARSGSLAIAIATSQNNEPMLDDPSSGGWRPIIDNTGGEPDRRLLGVWAKAATGPTVTPGTLTYGQPVDVGNGAHVHWTLIASDEAVDPQIPESELSFSIDPDRPETWGAGRQNLQLIQSGSGWNPGQTTTGFTTGMSAAPGYDLAWEPGGQEIRSFPMDDGDDRRLFTEVVGGRRALVGKVQWRNDDSYDPRRNRGGVNEGTSFPGIDRLFFDGSRALHYSDIDGYIRVGPGADRSIFAFAFVSEQWMWSRSNTTGPIDFHEPNFGGLTSPLFSFLRDGVLRLYTRDGRTPDGGITAEAENDDLGSTVIHEAPLAPTGQCNGFIVHFKIDPSSSDRFVELWTVEPATGAATLLTRNTAKVGYWYTDSADASGQFYLIHQMYAFHQFTDRADGDAGVVNNWDMDPSRVGPTPTVRRMVLLRAFGGINPRWGIDEAAADVHAHLFG